MSLLPDVWGAKAKRPDPAAVVRQLEQSPGSFWDGGSEGRAGAVFGPLPQARECFAVVKEGNLEKRLETV